MILYVIITLYSMYSVANQLIYNLEVMRIIKSCLEKLCAFNNVKGFSVKLINIKFFLNYSVYFPQKIPQTSTGYGPRCLR